MGPETMSGLDFVRNRTIYDDDNSAYYANEISATSSEETPFINRAPAPTPLSEDEDPRHRYKWPVVSISFSVAFLVEMALVVSAPAWNTLLEKGLCEEMYPELLGLLDVGEDNPLCRDAAVQGKLAMYRGWQFTLEALPTILFAVPYGSLSDKWGRKPVSVLSVLGLFLVMAWYEIVFIFPMPMWMLFFSFVPFVIGGGVPVGVSMLYTMLADVIHVDEMASILFRFNAIFLLAELIANPLGSLLLNYSPWLALLTGNTLMVIALTGLYFLPETLTVRDWHNAKTGHTPPSPYQHQSRRRRPSEDTKQSTTTTTTTDTALTTAREQVSRIQSFLRTNKRAALLILPFICVSLGRYIQDLLLQYATTRFHWSWARATAFLTLKSASFILTLTCLLPLLSSHLLRRGMSPLANDLFLSRWSSVLLVIADLVITFSSTPALYGAGLVLLAAGCGLPALLRSVLNALVAPQQIGVVNTLVGFLETVGLMVAAPVFSAAMSSGMEMGSGWVGLPFAVGTGISAVAAGIVWVYRIPEEVKREVVEEDLIV